MATVGLDVFRQPLGKQFRIGIEVGIQTLIRQESLHGAGAHFADIDGSILEYGAIFDPLGAVRFGLDWNLLG